MKNGIVEFGKSTLYGYIIRAIRSERCTFVAIKKHKVRTIQKRIMPTYLEKPLCWLVLSTIKHNSGFPQQ
jgi:hypothetical protein